MSNLLHISNKVRNGMVVGAASSIEVGAQTVKALIFSLGSGIPANENVGITDQVLLAEHLSSYGSDGFEDSATTGSLSANAFADIAAIANGAPAFFRLVDANNEVCMQGTCGVANAHMLVSLPEYIQGGMSKITSLNLSVPATSPAAV
ncbi:hypothetical protein [Cognaticolwellia mytili]|uniref:hypothetical protein n=1 Tax=Cognaticolwellia mytili TaxID=1888913 RepID=UPI000A174009|nr:hypothetical protein [Cognaticolwellia mytili]